MAFISNGHFNIGDWVILTKQLSNCAGKFTKGTEMKICGRTERGYDLLDEYGHRITEAGWGGEDGSFVKLNPITKKAITEGLV